MATKKESAPGPDGISCSIERCAGGLGSHLLFNAYTRVLAGGAVATEFAGSRTVLIPKTSFVDDDGVIVRPPDASHPMTLCDGYCNIITTAICFGLHRYSTRCIHPAQRCISSRQMTDNIFEVETTALAHVACATRESGILLKDFADAYSSVNHSWILEKAEVPGFICRFLRTISCKSTTEVEFQGQTRGQFRQGCLASGFLFALAFDPIFRWLHDAIIPRNPADPDFLQPPPCAYADDFAVAASSFRSLMTALCPAFVVVEPVARLNLNHRKCCWVQYGSVSCHELLDWVSTKCEEFCETKIVKYAKYVGTMIGPEGYLHPWTAPREKFIQRTWKINGTSRSLVQHLVDFKIFALSVLGYLGTISAPDGASLKEGPCVAMHHCWPLQCFTC